jgi:predicted transcriptional regulator
VSPSRRNHHFAKAVKREMLDAKMTRADLARRLHVGRTTVYDWLAGAEPSERNFKRLVKLFPTLSEFEEGRS